MKRDMYRLFDYLTAEAVVTQNIQIGPLDEPDEEVQCDDQPLPPRPRFEIVKLPPRVISLGDKCA